MVLKFLLKLWITKCLQHFEPSTVLSNLLGKLNFVYISVALSEGVVWECLGLVVSVDHIDIMKSSVESSQHSVLI